MHSVTVVADDVQATDNLGKLLAEHLPVGSVVALIGALGAGKTTLVQSVAQYLGVDGDTVSSPTFVLLHEYDGDTPVYHFDAYRLETESAFLQLGPDEYFEGNGITFVEWSDKFPAVLPKNHLEIRIDILGETQRRFTLTDRGSYDVVNHLQV
jgi:tRNA threonylcarbamoyladenosine biosynthesis protein TsaE